MRTLPPAVRTLRPSLVLSVVCLAAGCHGKEAPPPPKPAAPVAAPVVSAPPPPPPPSPNGELLAQHFSDCQQAFNRNDLAELLPCYAPTAVSRWIDSGLADEKGPSAIVDNRKKSFKTAFADGKIVPQLVLVNGSHLAATGVLSGVHTGPLMAADGVVSATHKPIGQLVFQTVTVDADNKLLEETLLVDRGSMLSQLGVSRHKGRPRNTQGLVNAPRVTVATGNATERLNLAVVGKQWQSLAAANLAAFAANLAEDVVLSDQAAPEDARGKGAAVKAVDAWLRGLDKIKLECPTLWAAGAYVVSVCQLDAVNDGDLGEYKKTGAAVSLTLAEVTRLDGGLEREIFRFSDGARLASELEGKKDAGSPVKGRP